MFFTLAFWLKVWGTLKTLTAAGLLTGAKMIAYTNVITVNNMTQLSDLVQPTYTGYGAETITVNGPYTDANNNVWCEINDVVFQMGDDSVPTTITGIGLVNAAGNDLLAVGNLDTPIQLVRSTDAAVIGAQLTAQGTWVVGKTEAESGS